MGKPSKKAILKAIEGSGGIVSTVAKKLRVTWNTADKYIKLYKETLEAFKEEEEKILDMCQSTIYQSAKTNTQDAKWVLSKKGKSRGWGDSSELNIGGQKDNPLTVETSGLDNLSEEEKETYFLLLAKKRAK